MRKEREKVLPLNAAGGEAKSDQPRPTTKAHPLDLRLSLPVAHSLVLTGVPVLASSGDE